MPSSINPPLSCAIQAILSSYNSVKLSLIKDSPHDSQVYWIIDLRYTHS